MAGEANWLRERLMELERIERPSASDGERRAAEWLVARLAELGAEARIEAEDAHGTYWWPLGIGAAMGAFGAAATLRGRRFLGALLGATGAAAMADDFPPGKRRLRRLLPRRTTYNVVCELGDPRADRTVVVSAHHDAPHSGLVFHPALPALADRLGILDRTETSPPLMAPVVGGPVLAALGSGRRLPEGIRVILLSTGSEESFSEGMKAFGERHFPQLPRESTFFLCLETLGATHLLALQGEGFLKMRDYPPHALAFFERVADEEGVWLYPNLRTRNGTDALEPRVAGYETVALCSCTDQKQPGHYHWPDDSSDNVNFDTVERAIALSETVVRRLGQRWL